MHSRPTSTHGHSLVETVVALAILALVAAVAVPNLRAQVAQYRLLGAARVFKGHFIHARSIATRLNVQTAIRFEEGEDCVNYSLYADGNRNGVLSRDIARGVDWKVRGPMRLDANVGGVRVAILPGIPALPPDTGILDSTDPIRFGRSNMLSFSPLGTATPGTFYLAGDNMQAAVRVTGGSARVRLMIYGGGKWTER
jgi:hypothetical protein